jgi:hypothetical protein
VPHHDDPGIPKDLLHEVNNQLEIVVGAAKLLSQQSSDTFVRNYCEQIQSAVFTTSNFLKTHFKQPISIQPARDTVNKPKLSAAVTGPDQGCIPQKSPANILLSAL